MSHRSRAVDRAASDREAHKRREESRSARKQMWDAANQGGEDDGDDTFDMLSFYDDKLRPRGME